MGKYNIYRSGKLRGEIIEYRDGVGCTIWYPFGDGDEEDAGVAFDFSAVDIDDMISLLQELKSVEPDIYIYDDEYNKDE